jgi:hypothetical protein
MKISSIAVLMTAAILSGCILSVPSGFSPVQGPLSQQSPIPTYSATISGLLSGTVSVVLDNGEVCTGQWELASKSPPTTSSGTGTPIDMAADWDAIYGPGYFAAHVLGNKLYARATLTGTKGTVLHVEFSNESNTRGGTKGVAADNRGNVFKVSVYN